MFLGGQPRPIPRGKGPVASKFWTPTYAHMVWPRLTKFGVVTHGIGACFYGGGGRRVSHGPNSKGWGRHYRRRVVRVDRCPLPWPLAISDLRSIDSGISVFFNWHPPGHCWARRCEGGRAIFSSWPFAFLLFCLPTFRTPTCAHSYSDQILFGNTWDGRVSRGQSRPMGWGPSVPQFLEPVPTLI